ncbi:unnamed protein product, partial [Musa textilis]
RIYLQGSTTWSHLTHQSKQMKMNLNSLQSSMLSVEFRMTAFRTRINLEDNKNSVYLI